MADPIVSTTQYTAWLASVGLSGITADATALTNAIAEAQAYCGRSFAYSPADAGADEARTFTGSDEPCLVIDDLLTLTSLTYVGTGTPTALTGDSYELEAVGASPYIYVTRKRSIQTFNDYGETLHGNGIWSSDTTITITGQWGYAATVPTEVVEAVCMLALVRQLSGREWLSAGHSSVSIGQVSRNFSGDMLKAKREEARGKLRNFKRVEKEPHL